MTWQLTTYLGTPSVERREDGKLFILTGNPAIWGARVKRVSAHVWSVRFNGPWDMGHSRHGSAELALSHASDRVGALVGQWWREYMTPTQRVMIGRQRACPFKISQHVYCGRSPGVGSVWCEAHPWGQS